MPKVMVEGQRFREILGHNRYHAELVVMGELFVNGAGQIAELVEPSRA